MKLIGEVTMEKEKPSKTVVYCYSSSHFSSKEKGGVPLL